jgi:class 3 adenylate cyclase/tetratricopeptide (TPR) repeat protein
MAEIFLARSFGVEGFEKHLVIKRILPDLAQSPQFVSLFIKEAKISASLSHPNIVQIYELGRVSTDHYIAMEYIHGRDLTRINKTLRADSERLPIPLAVFIVASILRGLNHAHTRTDANGRTLNLIHRDVSPHNVMVSFLGEVKLFDFGIARLVGESDTDQAAPGGGKYAYMSPEQASGKPMDNRSDLFSAGVVLYELLVGHRLFQDPNPAEKLRKVRQAEISDPRLENPDIPDELWTIVQAMLALDPDDRPSHAGVAEEELWAFLFRNGLRADAHELAAFMAARFPEEAKGDPGVADLDGLVSDLRRLEGGATGITDLSNLEQPTLTPSMDRVKLPPLMRGNAGERKSVVVLMAEVTGFTELSAVRDAAEVVRKHYQLLRRLRRIVDRHGGFLDHYQDDRFMVLFGVPKAGEHDLERAVACADAIQMMTRKGPSRSVRVSISIGIHRGEITVGSKTGRNTKYLSRGDTIKLAHRLCSEADLGEVLVSDKVAAMAGHQFRFTRGPVFRRKGSRTEHKSFALQGARDRLDPVTGRWIPRSDEMDQLSGAIARLAQGHGGVVSVVGGAGTGKSRFLREVQRLARSREVPFILARARPYRGYRPFDVMRDVVAHVTGLNREDDADVVQAQLVRLQGLGISEDDIQVISAMYGLSTRREGRLDIERMTGAACRLVDGIAAKGPAILAIDDVQYIRAMERQIIGSAIRGERPHPLLFLFVGRETLPSEFRPADRIIVLDKLKKKRLDELVRELLGAQEVDPTLLEVAQKTAEGNPLYVDEIVRSLRQAGRISMEGGCAELVGDPEDVHLPVGLEGMINARIDALGPACKGVLQIAAAIGMSFSPALVREASGMEDISGMISELVERGIIERGGPEDQGRAAFSSVLVWEAVHRSILGVRLSQYHRMIADGMERLYGERIDDKRMELAAHCAAGGQYLRASGHAERAGDHLRSQQMIVPAIDCWEEGVGWVDRMARPSHASRVREAALRLKAGEGWRLAGDPRKAQIHLQVGQDLAADVGDSEIEARATLGLGWLYMTLGRTVMSRANLESARSMAVDAITASSLDNIAGWRREVGVDALNGLGSLHMELGEDAAGEGVMQQARSLAGSNDSLAAKCLNTLAQRCIRRGDEEQSLVLLNEAKERSQRAEDPLLLGRIVNNIGIVHMDAGRYDEALKHYRDALQIREGIGYCIGAVINLHNIGDVHFKLGDSARAWASFKKSMDLAVSSGFDQGVVLNEAYIAYLEGQQGDEEAGNRLAALADKADRLSQNETRVSSRWLLGRHKMDRGDTSGARSAWEEGIALANELNAPQLAKDLQASLSSLS